MKNLPSTQLFLKDSINLKTIGIDIDEVLAHFLESYLLFHNEKHNSYYKRKDFFSYRFWEVVGGTKEEAIDNVHDFFETSHFAEMTPLEGSKEAIVKLSKYYDLAIITARQSIMEKETKKWLESHFPEMFSQVHFGNHYGKTGKIRSKSEICKELGIGILIEDSLEYAIECSKNDISVILFDSPWNKSPDKLPSNVIRVNTWNEILGILLK